MPARDDLTPRMRTRLRVTAVLAGFAGLVIFVAFVGAFRNTSANDSRSPLAAVAPGIRDGDIVEARHAADLLVDAKRYTDVRFFLVRSGGVLHALWERSPHLG